MTNAKWKMENDFGPCERLLLVVARLHYNHGAERLGYQILL
jgi:hypothetical protein